MDLDVKQEKIFLFGGAFDPFHLGHLEVIRTLKKMNPTQFRLILIPSSIHPQKETSNISDKHRMQLLRLVCESELGCEVSPFEINKGGISWSIDTVTHFEEVFPNASLVFVVGSDQFFNLHTWKNIKVLCQKVSFVVLNRGSHVPFKDYDAYQAEYFEGSRLSTEFVPMTPIDISSTQIRAKLVSGEPCDDFLPSYLLSYCQDQGVLRG